MVFNLASAALVYRDFQQNSTNAYVGEASFALSITELVLISLEILWVVLGWPATSPALCLLIVQVYNIPFSAFIFQYYNEHKLVDMQLSNMSLAILVLNSLVICGCCGGHRAQQQQNQ